MLGGGGLLLGCKVNIERNYFKVHTFPFLYFFLSSAVWPVSPTRYPLFLIFRGVGMVQRQRYLEQCLPSGEKMIAVQ